MTRTAPHRTAVRHADVAVAARAVPGVWVAAGPYASMAGALSAARRVGRAERMPSYLPAGAFEAYAATTPDSPVLWVRSTVGGPYPAMPERMTVRIPVGGAEVRTVAVRPHCPDCGGPRGWDRVEPVTIRVGAVALTYDQWPNPCGHVDTPEAVRAEADRTRLPAPSVSAAVRGMGHHAADPARAGAYREAVELVLQAAATRGAHAKQAAALLRLHHHDEAAELIERKIRAELGHLSARQAAHFLTVEGARRASARTTRQEANA